ncbi:rod shape-determining protein MreC [Paenibacillus pini]|uniref:Cell shape-determining protein MreC n=1 Tax=Paenibacillus pini JCM 16418 TaxID=1236976 RepID=W7YRI1_9BACL|nr:rod shape-determining protein MreC [Paenibacillus pini]GAF10038.1 rod shape-determining protein MreC [Paenibacillus pini JCM 16418]
MLGNKRLFVILIGLVMFIALMGFTLNPRASLSWPERFMRDTVGFVQNVFYKPAGFVAGLFKDIGNMKDIYKENEELKIALAQYTRDKANYNFIQAKNAQYEKDLQFKQHQMNKNSYQLHIAQVVSVNPDTINRTLVIDLGSRDGVKVGQSVISVDGLVGVISNVSNFSSTVQLITNMDAKSPKSNEISATAVGKENKTFGTVASYDPTTGKLLMTRIAEDDPIAEKDEIVSSGAGDRFPQG